MGNFGVPWESRTFAFDQFQFPACAECNNSFSDMENRARAAMTKLLEDRTVEADEVALLLDWFDKLRIGVWVSELLLHGNPFEIRPKFRMATRIGTTDRILYIGRGSEHRQGLNFVMFGDPVFMHSPSVATFRINHLAFVSFSLHGTVGPNVGHRYVRLAGKMVTRELELGSMVPAQPVPRVPKWPATSPKLSLVAQAIVPARLSSAEEASIAQPPSEFTRSSVYIECRGAFYPVRRGAHQVLPSYAHDDISRLMRTAVSLHGRLRRYVVDRMPQAPEGDPYQEVFDKVRKAGQKWVP